MLRKIDIYKPLPKKINYKINEEHVGCFFDYKKYVTINKLCENLIRNADDILFEALSVFSKNHYKHRDTLYYNLQTVEKQKVYEKKLSGYYILDHETNAIAYRNVEDAYHELLHLSSTYLDLINFILYSGFSVMKENGKVIGEGLTDGYIELLASRDLRNNKTICDFDSKTQKYKLPSYMYSTALCRQLEIIVGEKELESMFFKDGFNRLNEFLMKYKPEKEVLKFFKNCDAAALSQNHRSIGLNNRVLEAQEFLQDICIDYFPDMNEIFGIEKILKIDTLGFGLVSIRESLEYNIERKKARGK